MTDPAHESARLERLERSQRLLVGLIACLLVLQAWSLLRPAPQPGMPVLIQRAHANQILSPKQGRPKIMFTTTTSGASIYEWEWDGKKYVRKGYGH